MDMLDEFRASEAEVVQAEVRVDDRIPPFKFVGSSTPGAYVDARAAYAQECNTLLADVPVEDLNIHELRLVCEAQRLLNTGTVAQLRRRLEQFSAGTIQPLEKFVAIHFEPPSLPNGYHASLVGIPHFVLQYALLPELDPLSLLNLALTCKYLHGDAMITLQRRADKVIGRGATVMALLVYEDIRLNPLYDGRGIRKAEKKYQKLNGRILAEETEREEWANLLVHSMIDWNGSVNRCLARRIERKREGKAGQEERNSMLNRIPERIGAMESKLAAMGFTIPIYKVSVVHNAIIVEAEESSSHRFQVWEIMSGRKMSGKVKQLATGKVDGIDLRFLRPWSPSFASLAVTLMRRTNDQIDPNEQVFAFNHLFEALLKARLFSDAGFQFGSAKLSWDELAETLSLLLQPMSEKMYTCLGHIGDRKEIPWKKLPPYSSTIRILDLSTKQVFYFYQNGIGNRYSRTFVHSDITALLPLTSCKRDSLIVPADRHRGVVFGLCRADDR